MTWILLLACLIDHETYERRKEELDSADTAAYSVTARMWSKEQSGGSATKG